LEGEWEAGFIADPQIVATLTPSAGGESENLEFTIDENEAAYTGTFPAGYYTLILEFYEGDPTVAANKLSGLSLAVRIIAGQDTYGYSLNRVGRAT